jgi:dTMP kinase
MSKFIVFEGPDRCGKATQTRLLEEHLRSRGKKVLSIEVPIKTNPVYHVLYWMLGNGLAKKQPKMFQWLQYFNRQIYQWTTLGSLEAEYDYIISDRWSLSTVVYGKAFNLPDRFTEDLYDRLRRPDFTVILLGKSHRHDAEDTYEADDALQEKVRKLYAEWSAQHPGRSAVLDCNQPRETIAEQVRECLFESELLDN